MGSILIIEDDRAIADLLVDLLTDEGYAVRQATNGRDGLKLLDQEQPALILCDIMMPVLDGHEVCRRLRANPDYRSIPLVFMSAGVGAHASECDIIAFLPKPFTVTQVLDLVVDILGPPAL